MKDDLHKFLNKVRNPFIVVSAIPAKDKEAVVHFLVQLKAPVYLEGISGIREDSRLQHLRIAHTHKLWQVSEKAEYHIDGILRIGGVPTFRAWRDLEDKQNEINVCSISHLPFSGLSWGTVNHVNLTHFFTDFQLQSSYNPGNANDWIEQDRECGRLLQALIEEEITSEPSLFRHLSEMIPNGSFIYLGNSLPIREWDMAATYSDRKLEVHASRGVNGIDGQVSTFLGMAEPGRENWGIFGDLTMLYDMAGPWILQQLDGITVKIVVINNSGGKIFSRMFPHREFQNCHHLSMEHIAKHWGLEYYVGDVLPSATPPVPSCLIELIPDAESTERFWKKYNVLADGITAVAQ